MRKIINLLSVICVVFALTTVAAKADTTTPLNVTLPDGSTLAGQLTQSGKHDNFNGTVTKPSGTVYTIMAKGTDTGTLPNLTIVGKVTISYRGKVIHTINVNVTGETAILAEVQYLENVIAQLP